MPPEVEDQAVYRRRADGVDAPNQQDRSQVIDSMDYETFFHLRKRDGKPSSDDGLCQRKYVNGHSSGAFPRRAMLCFWSL